MNITSVEHLKPFKCIKKINDIMNEINEIKKYQRERSKSKAKAFLDRLAIKYAMEKIEYDTICTVPSKSIEENLSNAEHFLFYVANKIIIKETMGQKDLNEK